VAISAGVTVPATASGNTCTTATRTSAASGSTFVVFCQADATPNTPTDNKGNTYTAVTTAVTNSSIVSRMYYCQNGTGGSGHTWTFTTPFSADLSMYVLEILGGLTTGILDAVNQVLDSSSPFTVTSAATTQAAELAVAAMSGNSGTNPATHAESTGYTIRSEVTTGGPNWTGAIASKVLSATGAQTPSFTENGGTTAGVHIATFKEASGGGGALTGSSTLTFSQSGTLTGAGALSGSTTVTFSQSGTLTGSGALSGSSTVTFSPTSTLTGAGALVGSATFRFSPSGAIAGAGALAGSTTVTFSPTGTLTDSASGGLTGAATLTFTPTATLTGSGALSGSTTLTFAQSGALTGAGALAGASTIAFTPSGTLADGGNALIGATTITFTVTGALSGTGGQQASGGSPSYAYYNDLDAARQRRLARQRRERERESDEQAIQDEISRKVAKAIYAQERIDAERADLSRIQTLADSLMRQRTELPRPVLAAVMKAHEERTHNSLAQLDRLVAQMLEEEEAVVAALLLLED